MSGGFQNDQTFKNLIGHDEPVCVQYMLSTCSSNCGDSFNSWPNCVILQLPCSAGPGAICSSLQNPPKVYLHALQLQTTIIWLAPLTPAVFDCGQTWSSTSLRLSVNCQPPHSVSSALWREIGCTLATTELACTCTDIVTTQVQLRLHNYKKLSDVQLLIRALAICAKAKETVSQSTVSQILQMVREVHTPCSMFLMYMTHREYCACVWIHTLSRMWICLKCSISNGHHPTRTYQKSQNYPFSRQEEKSLDQPTCTSLSTILLTSQMHQSSAELLLHTVADMKVFELINFSPECQHIGTPSQQALLHQHLLYHSNVLLSYNITPQ